MTDRMCVPINMYNIIIRWCLHYVYLRSVVVHLWQHRSSDGQRRCLQKRFYSTSAAPRVNIPTVSCHVRRLVAKRNETIMYSAYTDCNLTSFREWYCITTITTTTVVLLIACRLFLTKIRIAWNMETLCFFFTSRIILWISHRSIKISQRRLCVGIYIILYILSAAAAYELRYI